MSKIDRRSFIKKAAAGTIAAAASTHLLFNKKAYGAGGGKRVLIIGGGVGGMTAAHELSERGYNVSLYETKDTPGGKARSISVPGSGLEGRQPLPGEHGFRFFPGFYAHLDNTMSRIPYGNSGSTLDNLVAPTRLQFARTSGAEIIVPTHVPRNINDIRDALKFIFKSEFGIPRDDLEFFARKLIQLLTSCDGRRFGEYEHQPWWTFIEAEHRSANYQRFLATGLMRCLVACQPRTVSARTGGYTFLQLLLSLMGQNKSVDRILDGPTNDRFIYPWLAHLRTLGVSYHVNSNCEELFFDGHTMQGARFTIEGRTQDVYADHVILAVPCEVADTLLTPAMKYADPMLSRIANLRVEWMNGIQFYLNQDVMPHFGHSVYFDSPWAVTSISQKSHWRNIDLSQYGDGRVRGVLSVDVSDWNTPGIIYGKPARYCSKQEILTEVWAQIKAHVNESDEVLSDDMLLHSFLDPAISFPSPGHTDNSEPLLVNTVSSWLDRPNAASGSIPNLYMASDYVQTHMDLASMESACEAARRAVNILLERAQDGSPRALVTPLQEPAIFAPFKELDRRRYERGQAWDEGVLQQI